MFLSDYFPASDIQYIYTVYQKPFKLEYSSTVLLQVVEFCILSDVLTISV